MAPTSYIHERRDWPQLTWDAEALAAPLAAVRHQQGKHLGRMEALGFRLRSEAHLSVLTEEVVKTSAIEGETLATDEVRSSIARRLGLDAAGLPRAGRQVDGVVEMMLDATRDFAAPLTKERLFAWHASLFPTGRSGMHPITVGAWRTAPETAPDDGGDHAQSTDSPREPATRHCFSATWRARRAGIWPRGARLGR